MPITFTTDPIIQPEDAHEIFSANDKDERVAIVNDLSGKAKSYMNRVQLNQDLDNAIVETHRGAQTPTIFLHAPVYVADFATYDLQVDVYIDGTLDETFKASDDEVIVDSTDYSARIDLVGQWFPCTDGSSYIKITYFGGWETIPGDVYASAIMQGRIDLKRMSGVVGAESRSREGETIKVDQGALVKEVKMAWSKYKVIV